MKSWKTTLIGFGGAGFIALGQYLQTGDVTVQGIVTAIVVALLGVFAKDHNVTGK